MDSYLKLLGHQELDRQHLELARAVASFSESESQRSMTIALNDFFEIWRDHTRFEEELMRHSGFPSFSEHAESHNLITREITQLFKISISQGFQSRDRIHKNLGYWFHDHLCTYDEAFVEYLSSQQMLMPKEVSVSYDRLPLNTSGY